MSGPSFDQWTPQRPAADFADVTVRAMLELPSARSRRRKRRSWFGIVSLAAFLIGTSTWAMWGQSDAQAAKPPAVHEAMSSVKVQLPEPPARPAPAPIVEVEPEVAPQPVVKAAPRRAAPKSAPKIREETPLIVMQPRCVCAHDGTICSCVE